MKTCRIHYCYPLPTTHHAAVTVSSFFFCVFVIHNKFSSEGTDFRDMMFYVAEVETGIRESSPSLTSIVKQETDEDQDAWKSRYSYYRYINVAKVG